MDNSAIRSKRNAKRRTANKKAIPAASPVLVTNSAGAVLRIEAAQSKADHSKHANITLALTTPP